jgi:hypothetical protein
MTKKRLDIPPALLARDGVDVGDMLVAGQRMADENGIAARGVELAIGLVGHLEGREIDAGHELQRPVGAEAHDEARRIRRLAARLACRSSGHSLHSPATAAAKRKRPALHRARPVRLDIGPLASCLTWLQAGRPNHHGSAFL